MKVSAYVAVSLDGYLAREDGDVSWLDRYNNDPCDDHGFGAFFKSVDCLVMGRKTYQKVLSLGGDWYYAGKLVVVLSHGLIEIPEALNGGVECMSAPVAEVQRVLAQRGFRHLYVDGGETIREFLEEGLVDTMTLTQVPILLGAGVPLFVNLPIEVGLEHVETRTYPSGLVQSVYRVGRTAPVKARRNVVR